MQKETSLETRGTSSNSRKWEYQCIFCSRTFESGRALGGHQNAHRFEPRESKRTHHMRMPKQDHLAAYIDPHMNVQPQISMNEPSYLNFQPLPHGSGGRNAPLIHLMPDGHEVAMPSRTTTRYNPSRTTTRYNPYQQVHPMAMLEQLTPPLTTHWQEWDTPIVRARQGMQSQTPRIGSDPHPRAGANDGVGEVDLELKLYF